MPAGPLDGEAAAPLIERQPDAPLALGVGPVSLEDVDISGELLERPVGQTNRKGEIAAMYALAGTLSLGSSPALKELSKLAVELCRAGSAGVSVIESAETGELFRWRALAGVIEHYEGGFTPREWSPCGECLKAGRAILYSYPARYFTYFQKLEVPIVEGLVIPMLFNASPVGTIWVVSHTPARRFNAEDVRIMTSLANFAASALRIAIAHSAGMESEIVWEEYVRRVVLRDELALEALFQETRALVFATALRIVSFQVDAEEVTADVYARVWMTAGAFDARRGSVRAWLISMARSGAIDRLRARAVRSRSEAGLLSHCGGEDPEAKLDAFETRQRLVQALRALPCEQRVAIEMFYFSELSIADIAAQLGNPVGTVKTRIRIGRMKLRRLLAALETTRSNRRSVAIPRPTNFSRAVS